MQRWLTLSVTVALLSCDSSPAPAPTTEAAATASTAAAASTVATAAVSAEPRTAPGLKQAKPKAYADTAEADLGTLPEGVGIAVGNRAPNFELPAVEGGQISLGELLKKSAVLLVFYRGGW